MEVVVNNGRCEVRRGRRWKPFILPIRNVIRAHAAYGHIAVILSDGTCSLFSRHGKPVHTYHFKDTKDVTVINRNRLEVLRSGGRQQVFDFEGCLLRVTF